MGNREQLAWCAGFFDGEGSFMAPNSPKAGHVNYPVVSLDQVDRRPLDRMVEVLGVGVVNGPYGPYTTHKGTKKQPIYRFYAAGFEKVQAVYAMLFPFLGEAKRAQGRKVLLAARGVGQDG